MSIPRSARHQPPRTNDPEGMRRKVLDAAYGLFQSRGYHATSIQDLMTETNISGGALHHHFPTKKSLALAVFKERVAPLVRETWIDPVQSAASLGRGIQSVFEGIIAGAEARRKISGCPLNNLALELSLVDRDFRAAADEIFQQWQTALGDRVRMTRGGRLLTKPARGQVAAFIVASYSGAMTLAKTEQSANPLRATARALKSWLQARHLDG